MKKLAGLALAALMSASLVLMPAEPAAANSLQGWESSTVYVVSTLPARYEIRTGARRVAAGSGLQLRVVRRCPAAAQCIYVSRAARLPGDKRGLATVWTLEGHIVKAEVRLQTRFVDQVTKRRRIALACHELAHAVGLEHSTSRRSCLYPTILERSAATHLDRHDKANLRALYGRVNR